MKYSLNLKILILSYLLDDLACFVWECCHTVTGFVLGVGAAGRTEASEIRLSTFTNIKYQKSLCSSQRIEKWFVWMNVVDSCVHSLKDVHTVHQALPTIKCTGGCQVLKPLLIFEDGVQSRIVVGQTSTLL